MYHGNVETLEAENWKKGHKKWHYMFCWTKEKTSIMKTL